MSAEQAPIYVSVGSIKEHLGQMHPEIPTIPDGGMAVFNARYTAHEAAHHGVEKRPSGEPVHTHTRPKAR